MSTTTAPRETLLTTYEVEVTCVTRAQADAMAATLQARFPRHNVRVSRRTIVGEGQIVHLEKEALPVMDVAAAARGETA